MLPTILAPAVVLIRIRRLLAWSTCRKWEMWTVNHEARLTEPGQRVKRIGINLGAPGDRIDSRGTLWVEYPTVGGEHADLDIRVDGDISWYRSNSLKFSGDGPAWIGASGLVNATRLVIPMSGERAGKGG